MINKNIFQYKKELDKKYGGLKKAEKRPCNETIAFDMHMITVFCESFPTCEGCDFYQEHIGCYFRGKTPREWN